SLLECLHDDGEPFGQAPALVGHARRVRRTRNPRVDARGSHDLDARVRRRAPRVTDQPPSPPPAEEPEGDTPAAIAPDESPTQVSSPKTAAPPAPPAPPAAFAPADSTATPPPP